MVLILQGNGFSLILWGKGLFRGKLSGVDRAFPGGGLAQPEGENEDKNEEFEQ